jgi:hypothetical protein
MRRSLINTLVCLCVGSFTLSASASSGAIVAATLAVPQIDSSITKDTTRERVFAMLGQPWIIDKANDRWVYPTQTIMFRNDKVVGVIESDAGRLLEADKNAKTTAKAGPKRKAAVGKPTTARKAAPKRKTNYGAGGPFASVKKPYFSKVDRPSLMSRGKVSRRGYSPVYSPYQAGRYGHNLSSSNGKRIVTRGRR